MPKYLQQRRRRWYAVLEIPKELRDHFGKPRFVISLKTDSLKQAQRLVGAVVSRCKTEIEAARRALNEGNEDELILTTLPRHIAEAEDRGDDTSAYEMRSWAKEYAQTQIAERLGPDAAREWLDRLYGRKVEIIRASEDWLGERQPPPKTEIQHRQALKLLTERHRFVEDLDRKTAASFVREVLRPGRKPATVARMLSTYSQLWKWLYDQGLIENRDLWSGLQPPKRERTGKFTAEELEKRRPYSEDEARRMFEEVDRHREKYPADPLTVRLLAVTGMRLDEVCSLETQHVTEDAEREGLIWIEIRAGKNRNAIRIVAVKDATTVGMLRTRIKERARDGDIALFPEYRPHNSIGSWSAAVSKRLGRRLKTAGIPDDPRLAQSHSWRHRARSIAERGGARPAACNKFFGHSLPGEGLGRYYTEELAEMAEIAEAVQLPEALSGYPKP
ncbi:Tyrosine recombinase XerC [wastewater metagenome]|uniref:Tyrosine recombinase XerC n=2 Tax=unclassified sequences TaxID=12908 RepID=A0A5B8RIG1_9ZZZZ|nr:DUF6538 domain-containing protein [Arhodomonas sp. KWT]QEA07344.1 tyrosine recombinase XerC [uncultured organism]